MLDSIGDGSQEKSYNFILEPGHILALPVGFFHCLLNITDKDLEFYEAFMSGDTNEITLLRGIQSVSSDVASGSLGLSVEQSEKMLKRKAPEFIVKF
jgi:oxalate decarboxylase/phosphoglucose isomerase-like protein (cupin superfamily)